MPKFNTPGVASLLLVASLAVSLVYATLAPHHPLLAILAIALLVGGVLSLASIRD